MKVKNETHWRTDDIRKMLAACIKHEGLGLDEGWRIRIYYTRRCNNVMGYAYYDSRTFKIGLPRRIKVRDVEKDAGGWNYIRSDDTFESGEAQGYAATEDDIPADATKKWKIDKHTDRWTDPVELPADVVKRFAQVTIHEIGHCKNLRHADMPPSRTINVDFAEGFVVRKKASALPKPPVDREAKARETLDRLEELIEKEEKRHAKAMKALKTRRTKARNSVRYYDRKAADK